MAGLTFAVTGVASGIGAQLASILKRQGHTVIGFDIRNASDNVCLLYTSPSPRDRTRSRMPSSA